MSLSDAIKTVIRDVPDFPKEGIMFKDITPILSDPELSKQIVEGFIAEFKDLNIEAIACVEARGFFFGTLIAQALNIPFIPIRKAGKLPYKTVSYSYDLEYGSATIEMHEDAVKSSQRILIHDDLLATGGTAAAAAELVKAQGGTVVGFSFLVDLTFLGGEEKLKAYSSNVMSLVQY